MPVVVLFCLPLFAGLGGTDLRSDEAIYAFAVDRTLETGDWLIPRSSPLEDEPFLEKPPLKIWIVAAAIRLGVLPLDEFGLRFWDAVFGSVAFLYVFAIGRRMAGPWCGIAAVLILFAHVPLLFDHGLREHTMEAALVLSYCGGIYHYFAWTSATGRRLDAVACGLYFVLGFMTKFVAVLLLPVVLAAAAFAVPAHAAEIARRRRDWLVAGALATACIVPWFAYAWIRFGWAFWQMMLGVQVYTRFTAFVDPAHLQPWHYYATTAVSELARSGSLVQVAAGFVLVATRTLRTRWPEGILVLLWLVIPTALISLGTSKLYHYAYPFLPPLALAGGYAAATLVHRVGPAVRVAICAGERWGQRRWPAMAAFQRSRAGSAAAVLAVLAVAAAIATAYAGVLDVRIGDWRLIRNSGVVRPLLAATVLATAAGRLEWAGRLAIIALALALLPIDAYRTNLERLTIEDHPIRSLRDCLLRVHGERSPGEGAPRLYAEPDDPPINHAVNYYVRRLQPWERGDGADDTLRRRLRDPGHERPALIRRERYEQFAAGDAGATVTIPGVRLFEYVLLLPGPYAVCALSGQDAAANR